MFFFKGVTLPYTYTFKELVIRLIKRIKRAENLSFRTHCLQKNLQKKFVNCDYNWTIQTNRLKFAPGVVFGWQNKKFIGKKGFRNNRDSRDVFAEETNRMKLRPKQMTDYYLVVGAFYLKPYNIQVSWQFRCRKKTSNWQKSSEDQLYGRFPNLFRKKDLSPIKM